MITIEETATYFPLPESSTLEFKQSLNSCSLEKIYETLCAFLNTNGGSIIFGVSDNRRIRPMPINKDMDKEILKIDSIFRSRTIITTEGQSLNPENIKCSILKMAQKDLTEMGLLVVTATATPNTKYCMKNGTQWYRLSASNCRMIYDRENYTINDVNRMVEDKTSYYREKMKILKTDFEKVVEAAKNIETMNESLKNVEKDMEVVKSMLHTLILKQKEETEHVLKKEKEYGFMNLFDCFGIW